MSGFVVPLIGAAFFIGNWTGSYVSVSNKPMSSSLKASKIILETDPAAAEPAEVEPEADPPAAEPADAEPADAEPADAEPAEAEAAEAEPAEAEPAEAEPEANLPDEEPAEAIPSIEEPPEIAPEGTRKATTKRDVVPSRKSIVASKRSAGPVKKFGEEVPFSIQRAATIPCGVWVTDGDKKWRVVDRKQKTLDIRTIRKDGDEKALEREKEKEEEVRGWVGEELAGKIDELKPKAITVERDEFRWSRLPGKTCRASKGVVKTKEVPTAKFSPVAATTGYASPYSGGASYGGGATYGGGRTYGGGVASFGRSYQTHAPVAPSLKSEESKSGESTTDEEGQAWATWSYWPTSRRRLSKAMTFSVGLALMCTGGIIHHLTTQINWDAVSRSILETYLGFEKWIVEFCLTVFPALANLCPRDIRLVFVMVLATLLLGFLYVLYRKGYRPRFSWSLFSCLFDLFGSEEDRRMERYQVTYSVGLSEEDWNRYQDENPSSMFRPVAPKLLGTFNLFD